MRSSWPSLANPTGKWAHPSSRGVALLIAILGGFYATQWLADRGEVRLFERFLSLSGPELSEFQIWRIFTYPLISIQPWPIVFLAGLALLYFAGRELEPILGTREFLRLGASAALFPGVVAGLALACGFPSSPIFGSLPMVLGVVVAYTTILPDIDLIVIRWPIKAGFLTVTAFAATGFCAVLAFLLRDFSFAMPFLGAAAGWCQVRQLGFGPPTFWQRRKMRLRAEQERFERMPPQQFISEQIDPILEKISISGRQSLSRREKAILKKAQEKLSTRH